MPPKKRGTGIVRLSSLFEKYQRTLQAPQGSVVQACITAVEEVLGITLTKKQCMYNPATKTITIHASGILKTEVLFAKKKILEHIKAQIGEKSVPKEIL